MFTLPPTFECGTAIDGDKAAIDVRRAITSGGAIEGRGTVHSDQLVTGGTAGAENNLVFLSATAHANRYRVRPDAEDFVPNAIAVFAFASEFVPMAIVLLTR